LTSISLDETPFTPGQFIAARLLPLESGFIFSGLQFILPDRESALEALEVQRALKSLDSPEAIEHAQREQCNAFRELFGCDELTISSTELNSTLQKFQRYLFAERRDAESGMTAAERFEKEFGRELRLPDIPPIPGVLSETGMVTILCDEFDGMVLLPDFNRFRTVFASGAPDRDVPGWQDLVWRYIKDPDIPIVAFERVAEESPKRVESIIRKLTGKKRFSLEHLYALLIHFKQPTEEFEELEDDERLWDLFEGNSKPKKSPASATITVRATPAKAKGAAKRPAGKKASPAKKTRAAAKPAKSAKATKPAKSAKRATPSKPAPRRAGASKKSKVPAKAEGKAKPVKTAVAKRGTRAVATAKRKKPASKKR
jgi:hypothetical protein